MAVGLGYFLFLFRLAACLLILGPVLAKKTACHVLTNLILNTYIARIVCWILTSMAAFLYDLLLSVYFILLCHLLLSGLLISLLLNELGDGIHHPIRALLLLLFERQA